MLVLTDLPDVMDGKLGWRVAAACMLRWFRNGSAVMTPAMKTGVTPISELPSNMLCTDLLTMDWAMRFARVSEAHDKLLKDGFSPKGMALLAQRVRAQFIADPCPVDPGKKWRFGDLSRTTSVVSSTAQINFLTVGGSMWDPLDDFYGAVGRGTLNLAVSGMVENLKGGAFRIEIDRVGVYLRDTYDFVGDQFLGIWWSGGVLGMVGEALGKTGIYPRIAIERDAKDERHDERQAYSVSNADFDAYRARFGHGGDYVNVSDVRVMQLSPTRVANL